MSVAQVGGVHYTTDANGVGHWDLMEKYDIAYLEGNATAYVFRWRRKESPEQDLLKAISYLEKRLDSRRGPRRKIPWTVLKKWCEAVRMPVVEEQIFLKVLVFGRPSDIREAVKLLRALLEDWKERVTQQ